LFNKSDIVGFSVPEEVMVGVKEEKAWKVSLSTGEGMASFLAGFAGALQRRYASICCLSRMIDRGDVFDSCMSGMT